MKGMKNTNIVTIAFILVILQSCTNTTIDSPVEIFLRPAHDESTGINDDRSPQAQITDNDGNLYATYWDVEEGGYDVFSEIVVGCRAEVKDSRLFMKALTLMQTDEQAIHPTIYAPFTECIYRNGYKLNGKEGYLPSEFNLSLFRGHSTKRNYLPVGARYQVKKKGASYLEVYKNVKACRKAILDAGGDGADEIYSGGYISVSIEAYSKSMETCLRNTGYEIIKPDN